MIDVKKGRRERKVVRRTRSSVGGRLRGRKKEILPYHTEEARFYVLVDYACVFGEGCGGLLEKATRKP